MQENIVKHTCKELGISYKELGDAIGFGTDTLRNVASQSKVSVQLQKAIELFLENQQLKADIKVLISAQAIAKKYT